MKKPEEDNRKKALIDVLSGKIKNKKKLIQSLKSKNANIEFFTILIKTNGEREYSIGVLGEERKISYEEFSQRHENYENFIECINVSHLDGSVDPKEINEEEEKKNDWRPKL